VPDIDVQVKKVKLAITGALNTWRSDWPGEETET
jgi:hypothetical protein